MTTAIKRRRGTTAQHATFTGLEGEITVDTTKDTVVVHDGATAGGFPLARESQATSAVAITGGTINGTSVGATTAAAGNFTTLGATGVATFSAGTVSAPAITTTGDTNTGIFFPAADTIAFTEGGVESMRIDSTGNVSIGTTSTYSIYSKLNVLNGIALATNSTDGGSLVGATTGGTELAYLSMGRTYNLAGTGEIALATNTAKPILFGTNAAERMRIAADGTVAIGATAAIRSSVYFQSANRTLTSTTANLAIGVSDAMGANIGGQISLNGKYDGSADQVPFGTIKGAKENGTSGNFAGYLAFATLASSAAVTEAMRIDSLGNVGIGTSSPAVKLDVQGSTTVRDTSTTTTRLEIIPSSDIPRLDFYNSGTQTMAIGYRGASAPTTQNIAEIKVFANSPLAFSTNNTERMRIDSTGNLLVGQTTSDGRLSISATSAQNSISLRKLSESVSNPSIINSPTDASAIRISAGSTSGYTSSLEVVGNNTGYLGFNTQTVERMRIDSNGALLIGKTSYVSAITDGLYFGTNFIQWSLTSESTYVNRNGTDGSVFNFYKAGTAVGSISVTGSATSYVTSSDYRLKENIAPMAGALAKVAQLKPVTYTWKSNGESAQGFIAHELQAVVPDCVTGEKDAVDTEGKPVYQGVDTSFLVATLTAAIQEQQVLINNLTTRLNALEGK
jgi:hypothetical protein